MSSSDSHSNPSTNQVIEHIVLFKVKPDADPSAVNAMITNIHGLSSLGLSIHLAAGPVSRCLSNSLSFTHMLHSRYRSKADLVSYLEHPAHVNVVSNYVKPIVDDIMVVDWVADNFSGPVVVSPGSAVRLTVLKAKEGAEESGKNEVLRRVKEKLHSIEQLTAGENFSPGKAKGFSICSIAILNGTMELGELGLETETKIEELVDGVLVLDYTVAS
ncbi:hypothetical protein CASFOL_032426 [Castilleja foliolosa]|uniref:Stress-response A/B barrel domain-containing protein n=1 Tax=Castilleja foliolosa TaxID=1961234 RepID=A0ABD3C1F0_9LAMI